MKLEARHGDSVQDLVDVSVWRSVIDTTSATVQNLTYIFLKHPLLPTIRNQTINHLINFIGTKNV